MLRRRKSLATRTPDGLSSLSFDWLRPVHVAATDHLVFTSARPGVEVRTPP